MKLFTFSLVIALLTSCGDTGCSIDTWEYREFSNGSYKYFTCYEETCPGTSYKSRQCRAR